MHNASAMQKNSIVLGLLTPFLEHLGGSLSSRADLLSLTFVPCRNRRTHMAATADLPVANDISTNSIFFRPMKATVSAVRVYLLSAGKKR
jgi:hypothetical protein